MVDLAGSEKIAKTGAEGKTLDEVRYLKNYRGSKITGEIINFNFFKISLQ